MSCRNVTPEGKSRNKQIMFFIEDRYIHDWNQAIYLKISKTSKYTSVSQDKTVLSKLLTNSGHSLSSSRGSGAGPSGVASTSTSASTGASCHGYMKLQRKTKEWRHQMQQLPVSNPKIWVINSISTRLTFYSFSFRTILLILHHFTLQSLKPFRTSNI